MEVKATVGQNLQTLMVSFVWALPAMREREDVAQIRIAMDHLYVARITVLLEHPGLGAVQGNVMVTQIAQVENAMLNTVNAV